MFLSKCKLPEIEFHKLRTIFWYKLGEYGFGDLHGWFHNNELYMIQFYGGIVRYDEYDIVFPDQFRLLMNLLKLKYGEPSFEHGLPKWTDVEKGSFHRCSVWYIGKKKVEVRVSCEGVSYRLDLVVERPDIKVKVRHEKEKQNTESIKKAVEIL